MIHALLLIVALADGGAPAAAGAEPGAPAPDCAAIQDPDARLACYDARYPPVEAARKPDDRFGLPAKSFEEGFTLRARVVGPVEGWKRGAVFKLDNGQVWRALEDARAHYMIPKNSEIAISRSAFGAYWMEFVGNGARVKVKRIS